MNTNDYDGFKFNNKFSDDIWIKQEEILKQYLSKEKIEIDYSDFDINLYDDQMIFKDFFEIRTVEELTEAFAARDDSDHFMEEIVDAFNFMLEGFILYGKKGMDLSLRIPDDLKYEEIINDKNLISDSMLKILFYDMIQKIGETCNFLKNRPWKQTQYLVDLIPFEKSLFQIFETFNKIRINLRIPDELLYKVWSQKYQVNKYRMETNY